MQLWDASICGCYEINMYTVRVIGVLQTAVVAVLLLQHDEKQQQIRSFLHIVNPGAFFRPSIMSHM
jgi:hypothetical protein